MRSSKETIDATSAEIAIVERIFRTYVPDREIRAFGTRANGKARKTSDLDLAVLGDAPLPFEVLARIKNALDESTLKFKVDVIDYNAIDESFRKIVDETSILFLAPRGECGPNA